MTHVITAQGNVPDQAATACCVDRGKAHEAAAGDNVPSAISPEMEKVLALNNAFAADLSWLDPRRLSALIGQAFYARRARNQ